MRWYSMSVGFLSDPKVEALGEKHGPAGPLVAVSLLARAALEEKGGDLTYTFRSIANDAFIDRSEAEQIVASIIETGLCHEVSRDVTGVSLTFPAWSRHQAAGRKAKQRAREADTPNGADKPHEKANVTPSHASRDTSHAMSPTRHDSTRQDKTDTSVAFAPDEARLSHLLADLLAESDPNGKRPTVTKAWAEAEDRMLRLDERNPVEAERLIRWTQGNEFWRGNVRSMPKFRERYAQLYNAAVQAKQTPSATQPSEPDKFAEKRQRDAERRAARRAAA